jgi:hypothetical protein
MNWMQMLVDGMNAQAKSQRSETQMTLGGLIDRLEQFDSQMEIDGICEPHSYRGYYSDLAFKLCGYKRKVADTLAMAKDCMGETFEGYKGGDFEMSRNTPVWIANYGSCGERIMSINDDGSIVTAKEE